MASVDLEEETFKSDHVIIRKTSPYGVLPTQNQWSRFAFMVDEFHIDLWTNNRQGICTYHSGSQFEIKFDLNFEFLSQWHFWVKPMYNRKMNFLAAYQCPTKNKFIILAEARNTVPPLSKKLLIGKIIAFKNWSTLQREAAGVELILAPPKAHYQLCKTCKNIEQ